MIILDEIIKDCIIAEFLFSCVHISCIGAHEVIAYLNLRTLLKSTFQLCHAKPDNFNWCVLYCTQSPSKNRVIKKLCNFFRKRFLCHGAMNNISGKV